MLCPQIPVLDAVFPDDVPDARYDVPDARFDVPHAPQDVPPRCPPLRRNAPSHCSP